MDQKKNAQTPPTQGHQGQQRSDRQVQDDQNWNDQPPTKDRDRAEGSREQTRGTGSQGERNSGSMGSSTSSGSSGISNRGMSSEDEQADLPSRGSSSESSRDQSER